MSHFQKYTISQKDEDIAGLFGTRDLSVDNGFQMYKIDDLDSIPATLLNFAGFNINTISYLHINGGNQNHGKLQRRVVRYDNDKR